MINLEHSLCSIDNRGIIFLTIISPAGGHRSDDSALHSVNADCIVIYTDQISITVFLIQCRHFRSCFFYCIIKQVLDKVCLMYTKVCHSSHSSSLFIEEPVLWSGIYAPGFRTAMSECCFESKNLTDIPMLDEFSCFCMSFGKSLILSDHEFLTHLLCCIHHHLTVF